MPSAATGILGDVIGGLGSLTTGNYTPSSTYAPGNYGSDLGTVLGQVSRTQATPSAPVASPGGAPTNTGGSVLSAAQQAASAKAAADAAKMASFDSQHQGITDSANANTTDAANKYKSGILDYLDTARQKQNSIDQMGTQAELAKRQGGQSVLDYVNDGIRSGGTMLANKNASNSSATEALARAYSTLGQHQMAGVGTQYAQDQSKIDTEQTNFNVGVAQQGRHNEENKTAVVNGIVADAGNRLQFLDAAIAGASLPQRIQIEQEKQQIRDKAMAQLQQYDPSFQQGVAGINPTDSLTRQGAAADLANKGTTAANPYQLTTEAPAVFSDGGQPAGSSLPIFTLPRKQQG